MAFNGYLFQFGNYIFPMKHIKWNSYDSKPNQRQDLDSYTDANGVTHRNALEHTKTEISFITWDMPESSLKPILDNMRANYINFNERDANCTYYDLETLEYKTGHFYLDPSLQIHIKSVDGGKLCFGEITWLFIEY